jgi:hypothetical protein
MQAVHVKVSSTGPAGTAGTRHASALLAAGTAAVQTAVDHQHQAVQATQVMQPATHVQLGQLVVTSARAPRGSKYARKVVEVYASRQGQGLARISTRIKQGFACTRQQVLRL